MTSMPSSDSEGASIDFVDIDECDEDASVLAAQMLTEIATDLSMVMAVP